MPAFAGHQGMYGRRPMNPTQSHPKCQRSPAVERRRPQARSSIRSWIAVPGAVARVAVGEVPEHRRRPRWSMPPTNLSDLAKVLSDAPTSATASSPLHHTPATKCSVVTPWVRTAPRDCSGGRYPSC